MINTHGTHTHTHTHTRASLQCNSISEQINSNIHFYQHKGAKTRTHTHMYAHIKKCRAYYTVTCQNNRRHFSKIPLFNDFVAVSSSRKCEATHLLTSSFNDFQLRSEERRVGK